MAVRRIAQLLKEAIGLDAASIGPEALACAIRGRMAEREIKSAADYAADLATSPEELRALIEAVVVPETWFFRDREAFKALAEFARPAAPAGEAGGGLRLLSLPCSFGEEPYSLAMTLLDAGLSSAAFQIHAFDVSRRAVDRARAGLYGRNSFRGRDLDFRARHFVETDGGWRIKPTVADCVRFAEGNLLALGAAAAPGSYDFVFCRNLLIYFDQEAQQRAIGILAGLLKPDGLIFVGPGEANLMLNAGFASMRQPLAFGFRRVAATSEPARAPRRAARRLSAPPSVPSARPFTKRAAAVVAETDGEARSLAEARRLADLGRIEEAALACEAHLRRAPSAADAWRLLGVLCEARREVARAAECYRKALYLDPADAETLGHLALLLQRQGDLAGAARLQARARRVTVEEG